MLSDLIIILALCVPVVVLFRRLGLPSIAGVLCVGAVVGPHGLRWIAKAEEVEKVAELGVVLLLFTIGLEFSLPKLLLQGRRLVYAGGMQVLLTAAAVVAVALWAGAPAPVAILLGLLIAPSSTAFVMKVLTDTRQIDAPHGAFAVGILLFQDLCVIPMMLALPLLQGGAQMGIGAIAIALLKATGVLLGLVLLARHGFPRMARLVVRFGGRELFTLFVVLVALFSALATESMGLSLALGAFVAGLFIGESEYSHQVVAEILPFRDVFNALFFVSIGMLFDFHPLMDSPGWVLGIAALLIVGKAAVMLPVGLVLRHGFQTSLLAAFSLAQVGEFSFVILKQAERTNLLPPEQSAAFLEVAVLTMLVSPFLIQLGPILARRVVGLGTREAPPPTEKATPVIVLGYGLNGQNLARVLNECGLGFCVVEMNPERVEEAKRLRHRVLFGDGSRVDTLLHAGIEKARILVVAIADPEASRRAVAVARRLAPRVHIIVRTRYVKERDELVKLGANQVIPEEFETSIEIFSRVLRELGVPRGNIAVQAELIRREGYQFLRDGADPLRNLELLHDVLAETTVETLRVGADSPAIGHTLGELDLRRRTGASVIAIVHGDTTRHSPGPDYKLEPESLMVVTGSHEQIARCREVVLGGLV